ENPDDSLEEDKEPEDSEEEPATDEETEEPDETDDKKDEDESFWDKVMDVINGKDEASDKDEDDDDFKVSVEGVPEPETYKVSFVTNGGTEFADKKVAPGTEIDSFPTPYKANSIFEGWYYDEEGTLPVASTDTVEKNLTLYASYIEMSPLEAIESKQFASAIDVESNFRITVVTEDKDIDTETVLAGIEAKNLSNPDQKDFIRVTGGNGTFFISGTHLSKPGFEEGASFRITLKDGRLNFKDEPESVREYNFTTFKEEVSNLKYNDDITYIPASDLSEITINGEGVESLNIPLYTMSTEGETDLAKLDKGTFKYSKGELEIGEIVTVYKGVRPDLRTLDTPYEECGEVAYIEITGRNGDKYSYQKAEAEDIIFEPDMLPMPVDADTDKDENSVTVENKYLDYSADAYANIELDSQTTVDPGDFLVFYTGNFGIESGENAAKLTGVYGEVISVTDNGDGTTTIIYFKTNWDDVVSAMDVYTTDTLSGDFLLEGVDVEALEAEIEQQAIDSGFAEEAAQYLASLALATDNFTKLSENMNLEDYKVELSDGTPISPEELQLMDSSVKAEFELEKMKPTVGIHPSNLDEYNGKGLVVGLEMEGTLTISKKGSDNTIEITISGSFLEELSIDIGASHKAIWDNWGPFPYISEYRVTANVDLRNFTGLEVNATMVTKEADDEEEEEDGGDDEEGDDITGFIKDLLEKITEEGEEEEEEDEDGSNLVKHYSEMLEEEADFLKIVDAQMFEKKVYCSPQVPIICMEFQADFIIEMEACVSIGFDFEYQTGKRYVFTIDVFDMKAYSDTITLVEETYEFCFYAMGRLGVRAGIELTFKVGLFDTSTNSVGLQAGAGAYTKLWGYFYYELTYSESQGRDQNYNGALLIEVGAFLELGINAQVLEGALAKDWEILDKEWPLWHVGAADNILDFTTAQEDMPNIKLKQYIRNATLPDTAFMLHYLDLQEGEEMDAVYEDYYDASKPASEKNRNNFTIKFTNDKFSYDPQTNAVVVTPAEGDEELYGEMIITWNHYPLAFSSKPIQRTVSIHWDNYRSGYVIVPYTGGGTYIPIIVAEAKEPIEAPADPEKLGYIFDGWYLDEEYTESYTFPEIMPGKDAYIYAKWEPRTDIPYRVEHYQQQLASGNYEIFETEEFTGTTDTYVTPAVKNYVGYNSPAAQELKVLADGSAVIRYYYDLQWASVTFNPGEIGGEAITHELKYGARIAAPQMAEKGYTFLGWDKEVVSVMGTEDVTYTAQWAKNPDTEYRIEYYVEQVDGRYALQHLIEAEAYTGDTFTAETLRNLIVDKENGLTADEKYTLENAFQFENMTVKGISCEVAEIEGSGKTVIKINYNRVHHNVVFDFGYDEKIESYDVCYGGRIFVPSAERTGYDFKGWSLDGETVVTPEEIMGTSDLTYIAVWTAHSYTVSFDKNSANATGTMEDIVLTYDIEAALTKNGFKLENYVFAGWGEYSDGAVKYSDGEKVKNLTAEDGKVITLYAHWVPEVFDIIYHGCENAVNANPVSYTVESETITLSEPVKGGYIFKGWYKNASYTGERITAIEKGSSGKIELYAKWEARTDIPYRVEHYQETADGDWALIDTDNLEGSIDTPIYPAVKAYEHYESPSVKEVYITLDGTTVVRYEYTRKYYTITLDVNEGVLPAGAKETITAKHGTAISLPNPTRDGYGFDGWFLGSVQFSENVMPTKNITLVAKYTEGQFGYTVNHYLQRVDGNGYELMESVNGTAAMDSDFTAKINSYTGFTSPNKATTIKIGFEESKNVVDYYYSRNQYNLKWNLDGGKASGYTEGSVYYGAAIVVPAPIKTGYSYRWDKQPESTMPAYDLEYTAIWTPNKYSVVFDVDGGTVSSGSVSTRTVTFGSEYGELPVLTKRGYSFDGWYSAKEGGKLITAETVVSTAEDHTLYARFSAVTYTITYNGIEGATNDNPDTYSVKTGSITLNAPIKEGFTFEGWYLAEDFSGDEIKTIAADRAE
ncbi:MAG: InlB B-repeat-containing protein, partial [Oscillospiraceae bacterium]|nr:InlB B-repeat-containing protein [Oscillospiraceae bacterium]